MQKSLYKVDTFKKSTYRVLLYRGRKRKETLSKNPDMKAVSAKDGALMHEDQRLHYHTNSLFQKLYAL